MTNQHEQLDTITVKTTAKSDGTAYAFVYDNDELVYAVKDTATKFEESISSRARKGYIALKTAYDYACEQNKQERVNELGWHLIEAQEKAQELYNELNPQVGENTTTDLRDEFIKSHQSELEKLESVTIEMDVIDNDTVYVFVYDRGELVHVVKDTFKNATQFKNSTGTRARKEYIAFKDSYEYALQSNKQSRIDIFGKRLADAQAQAQALYNELHPQQETIEVTITLDGHDPVTMSEPDAIEYFNVVFNTNNTPQWIFETEIIHDELRVYASRNFDYKNDDDDYSLQPDTYNWVMIDDDNGYLVIGDVIEISSQ